VSNYVKCQQTPTNNDHGLPEYPHSQLKFI